MQEFKCFFMSNLFTPLYFYGFVHCLFSFHDQNTLYCYAIVKKVRVLFVYIYDCPLFSRTPTLSAFFHGPNILFCNNISRNLCVPLCLLFMSVYFFHGFYRMKKFWLVGKVDRCKKYTRRTLKFPAFGVIKRNIPTVIMIDMVLIFKVRFLSTLLYRGMATSFFRNTHLC